MGDKVTDVTEETGISWSWVTHTVQPSPLKPGPGWLDG